MGENSNAQCKPPTVVYCQIQESKPQHMKRRQENSLQGRQRGRERENPCERGWSRDQQLSQPVKCLIVFSEKDTLFSL